MHADADASSSTHMHRGRGVAHGERIPAPAASCCSAAVSARAQCPLKVAEVAVSSPSTPAREASVDLGCRAAIRLAPRRRAGPRARRYRFGGPSPATVLETKPRFASPSVCGATARPDVARSPARSRAACGIVRAAVTGACLARAATHARRRGCGPSPTASGKAPSVGHAAAAKHERPAAAGRGHLSQTTVAPHPPRWGGASAKRSTSAWAARTCRTRCRWKPMPRPWISRTSRNPRSCAASRYSSTTDGMSRG